MSLLGLKRRAIFSPGPYKRIIAKLFSNNEPGVHFEAYDPNALYPRRNRLTWSEDFTKGAGAPWTYSNISSVTSRADGVGDLAIASAVAGTHTLTQTVQSIGVPNTLTVRIKAGGYSWIALSGSWAGSVWFDVLNGVIGSNSSLLPAFISAAVDAPGYFDCIVTGVAGGTNFSIFICNANGVSSFTGDGASGIYIARAQLEWNTTTATPYQKVTDWNTEYLAAVLEKIGMWQDSAGTTPVTGIEQPVGLWFDAKNVINYNVITNPAAPFTNWHAAGTTPPTVNTADSFSGSACDSVTFPIVSTGGFAVSRADGALRTTPGDGGYHSIVIGRYYRHYYEYALSRALTGSESITIYTTGSSGSSSVVSLTSSTPTGWQSGTTNEIATSTGANYPVIYATTTTSPVTVYLRKYLVREVAGNHATQATSTQRPILRALYNMLIKTEQFDDAAWNKTTVTVTANATTGPFGSNNAALVQAGAGTVTKYLNQTVTQATPTLLSFYFKAGTSQYIQLINTGDANMYANFDVLNGVVGNKGTLASPTITTVGNGWFRCSVSFADGTFSSGWRIYFVDNLTATYGMAAATTGNIYVWGADLRTSDDAAKNIPSYQRVNSGSDYDTTGFPCYLKFDGVDDCLYTPSVDFTGVDKITVWAAATKLSDATVGILAELSANAGANPGAFYIAGPGSAGLTTWAFAVNGTTANTATVNAAAPDTAILTGSTSISGNYVTLSRNNGAASTLIGLGTGNFGNYPIYLGRRGNTALQMNVRVHCISIRGSTTPSSSYYLNKMTKFLSTLAGVII